MNRKYEWSALILRVVLGVSFFVHGLAKFQGGLENSAGWFDSIGLPGFLAYGVAFLEAAGGIALVIGLGTKVLSTLFALLMIGAMVKVKLAAGFLGDGQSAGYELDLAFLAMAVSLVLTGSKLYSV
ncbi:DoxX family protein [Bacillus badius]|uniref:DoxX family protein n=1 Tax=Bacillus badius TaxID=1455 RepID=UPI000597E8EF|nr:DoxX family protein [Bacillus badius]KIL74506.1 putative membrane protein [Bacillus badius]